MDKQSVLDEIFENDPDGILEVRPRTTAAQNEDQRLVTSFEEINVFIDTNGREPERNMSNIQESQLFSRLKGLREHEEKMQVLQQYDRHGLLTLEEEITVDSIEDIFESDDFGILEDEEDIYTLKHVSAIPSKKADPDFVANREECEDFEQYEPLLQACQDDLREGRRRLVPSLENQLHEGMFCVLDGVLLYIAKIFHPQRGNSRKINRRTLLVFENGTKSNMLLRSLGKRLKDNGKMITSKSGEELNGLIQITDEDEATGFIYILKSKSEDDRIMSIKNLYKIGFSTTDVKERIKNAENEPTYLMAAVTLVSAFQCFNMNPHKLEQLLHRFFGKACLDIEIEGNDGQKHTPREWFVAPLGIIEKSIELILTGEIVKYQYDYETEMIVEK